MNFLPGPLELVLILVIVAMLFGVGKLPDVFGAVGKGIKEFRKEATDDLNKSTTTTTTVSGPVTPITGAPIVTNTDVVNEQADKVH